jgi:hypothetical protein
MLDAELLRRTATSEDRGRFFLLWPSGVRISTDDDESFKGSFNGDESLKREMNSSVRECVPGGLL